MTYYEDLEHMKSVNNEVIHDIREAAEKHKEKNDKPLDKDMLLDIIKAIQLDKVRHISIRY